MKTIEQKAKDFDKALTKARKYYEETPNNVYKAMLENLFPELAESEDEKIRKYLIDCVTRTIPEADAFKEISKEQILAWLEKQGSEPNWCHHKVDLSNCPEEYRKAYYDGWNNCNMQHSQCKSEGNDVVKCLINGMKFYYEDNEEATWGTEKFPMKVKDILSWLEKQGEQKSTECIKFSNEFENQISHLLVSVLNREHEYNEGFVKYVAQSLLGYAKNELKPIEWSEEDEEMVEGLNNCLDELEKENGWRYIYVNDKNVKLNKVRNWLKSIKDRVQSQPKQEWKQENREELTEFENAMMHIGDSFFGENAGLDPNDTATIKEQAELLLELAPKTEWSEEDERMLNLIIQDYEAASKSFCGHKGKLYWLKSFKKE